MEGTSGRGWPRGSQAAFPSALAPPLPPEREVAQKGKQARDVWVKRPGESLRAQVAWCEPEAQVSWLCLLGTGARPWEEQKGAHRECAVSGGKSDLLRASLACRRCDTCPRRMPKWNRCFRYSWTHKRRAPRRSKRYRSGLSEWGQNSHSSPPSRPPGGALAVSLACCGAWCSSGHAAGLPART